MDDTEAKISVWGRQLRYAKERARTHANGDTYEPDIAHEATDGMYKRRCADEAPLHRVTPLQRHHVEPRCGSSLYLMETYKM